MSHPAVRATAAEPCPFCGCGLPLATHAAKPKRRAARVRYRGPAITWDELPADWQRVMRSRMVRRDITKEEQAALDTLNRVRGMVAIVDDKRNAVRFEPGQQEEVTAA